MYNCSQSGCHAGGTFDSPPNLAQSNVGAALKGMNASILCADMKYVDPSNPKKSVLYQVVATRDCSDQMPLGQPLEGDELKTVLSCIEDWISKQ
jgi:hypothetical protein